MSDDSTSMDVQISRKRKRAAVACTQCHDRKVRCNVALQGVPCSNCVQDGTHCRVYGQQPQARPGQPLRPREPLGLSREIASGYPLTPSPGSANTESTRTKHEASANARDGVPIAPSPRSTVSMASPAGHAVNQAPTTKIDPNLRTRREPQVDTENNSPFVPFHAGESEGLEFLFDICSPNRPVKGGHYVIARNVHKRDWKPQAVENTRPLLPPSVCDELVCCFFYYVYPFLPVVDAGDFLTKFTTDPTTVSRTLLWSIFFASANYLNAEAVESSGFKSRKSLKEYCYQNAKAGYDSQQESDKPTIIASTLLLAFWYVDLEDLDGTWHWIGVASNLCQTIGLHREPNYARVPRCPFSHSQQALWRRLWWCCYYRDAWAAIGFGRPMRVHLDDCDVSLPAVEDVVCDWKDVLARLKKYMPQDLTSLTELWIKMLQLSIKLEDVHLLYYRPRRPAFSMTQLEKDDAEIWQLFDMLPRETDRWSQTLILHLCHLKCYFNSVIISLHRPYITSQPDLLALDEQKSLKSVATQRCKSAAASTTTIMNRLISEDLIDFSPTMLITAIMAPVQIHFFEYAQSEGLARQHAYHNLNLHMMVLSHLKKTFWSADMQHNLFAECLKGLDGLKGEKQLPPAEPAQPESSSISRSSAGREDHPFDLTANLDPTAYDGPTIDDLFWTSNPFYNMQTMFDNSPAVDWNTANPLMDPPEADIPSQTQSSIL